MKIRWAEPALFELEASTLYFREFAPFVAPDFAASIEKALLQLREHPYSAQETEKPGIRRLYIRRFRYLIFYTVEEDQVVILHIRHAARRWPWDEE
jgi:toxin ParE1/3/4